MSAPKPERELLATARRIVSLQREARKLRRRLKQIKQDLKVERRHMNALSSLRDPNIIPVRGFGPAIGLKQETQDKPAPDRTPTEALFADDTEL